MSKETKCKECINKECSLAGKRNLFMSGNYRCASYKDESGENEESERDFVEEYYEYVKKRIGQIGVIF